MLRVSKNGAPWRLVGPLCRAPAYVGNWRADATTQNLQKGRLWQDFRAFLAKSALN
jgi:hypothetical protein